MVSHFLSLIPSREAPDATNNAGSAQATAIVSVLHRDRKLRHRAVRLLHAPVSAPLLPIPVAQRDSSIDCVTPTSFARPATSFDGLQTVNADNVQQRRVLLTSVGRTDYVGQPAPEVPVQIDLISEKRTVRHARLANSSPALEQAAGERAGSNVQVVLPTRPMRPAVRSSVSTSIVGRHGPFGLVTRKGEAMPRPVPIYGRLETSVLDFKLWKRRALADGRIDEREIIEGVQIATDMANTSGTVIRTTRFAAAALTCADGMDSTTVRRQWEERQSELLQLDDYRHDGGPQAA